MYYFKIVHKNWERILSFHEMTRDLSVYKLLIRVEIQIYTITEDLSSFR